MPQGPASQPPQAGASLVTMKAPLPHPPPARSGPGRVAGGRGGFIPDLHFCGTDGRGGPCTLRLPPPPRVQVGLTALLCGRGPPGSPHPRLLCPGLQKLYILGGDVAESVPKCTHLIASKVTRTVKFLTAVSVVKHIVTPEWLDESFRCQKFIGERAAAPLRFHPPGCSPGWWFRAAFCPWWPPPAPRPPPPTGCRAFAPEVLTSSPCFCVGGPFLSHFFF